MVVADRNQLCSITIVAVITVIAALNQKDFDPWVSSPFCLSRSSNITSGSVSFLHKP